MQTESRAAATCRQSGLSSAVVGAEGATAGVGGKRGTGGSAADMGSKGPPLLPSVPSAIVPGLDGFGMLRGRTR
eukprot:3216497-Rhodomonas_salina.4